MKFDIKHDSWHMWLANFGRDKFAHLDVGETTDICRYTRLVFFGLLRLIGILLMVVAVSSWVLFCIGNLYGWLFLEYKLEPPTVFAVTCFLVCSLLLAVAFGKSKWDDYRRERYWKQVQSGEAFQPRKPSFMALVYRKFKDKTCFKLEVK